MVTNVVTTLVPFWGMTGIWTRKFGFHNAWEFWYVVWRSVQGIQILTHAVIQGI